VIIEEGDASKGLQWWVILILVIVALILIGLTALLLRIVCKQTDIPAKPANSDEESNNLKEETKTATPPRQPIEIDTKVRDSFELVAKDPKKKDLPRRSVWGERPLKEWMEEDPMLWNRMRSMDCYYCSHRIQNEELTVVFDRCRLHVTHFRCLVQRKGEPEVATCPICESNLSTEGAMIEEEGGDVVDPKHIIAKLDS